MSFEIRALDSVYATTAVFKEVISAWAEEEINGVDTIELTLADTDKWTHILTGTTYLRWINLDDTTEYKTYRIFDTEEIKDGNRLRLFIKGEHIKCRMQDEVFTTGRKRSTNCTVQTLLNELMAISSFDSGTVSNGTDIVDEIEFEYNSILYNLMKLALAKTSNAGSGRELSVTESTSPMQVNLTPIGASNNVQIRYRKNLQYASRKTDRQALKNRIYPVGSGDPPLDIKRVNGDVAYKEDAASQATYGIRSDIFTATDLEDINNLVATPALDGTYTAGLCVNWAKVSTPTLTENTDRAYILHGEKSQHAESTADGRGISQNVTVVAATSTVPSRYSIMCNVFIVSGTVRLQAVNNGTSHKVVSNGIGLWTGEINAMTQSTTTLVVSILQDGAGSANFYIDSVQVTKTDQTVDFVIGDNATNLMARANLYLATVKDPIYEYRVTFLNRYDTDPREYPYDKVRLGDTIYVIDEDLGLNISARVKKRRWNIQRPWQTEVEISNARSTSEKLLTYFYTGQQGLTDAKTKGDTRHGLKGKIVTALAPSSVRKYDSDIQWSSDDYNRYTFTSGTLKRGSEIYTITGATVSGLDASNTYYIYHDITNPSTFSNTKSLSDLLGENRTLVATVFTGSGATGSDEAQILPLIGNPNILGAQIIPRSIFATNIAATTITANEIAANTITASQIAAGTITSNEIAANTITAADIAANTITAAEIAAGAVSTSELAATAITSDKLSASLYIKTPFIKSGIAGRLITGVGAGSTQIELDDASDFPSSGKGMIDTDEFDYTGKSTNTLTGVTNIASSHSANSTVTGRDNTLVLNCFDESAITDQVQILEAWSYESGTGNFEKRMHLGRYGTEANLPIFQLKFPQATGPSQIVVEPVLSNTSETFIANSLFYAGMPIADPTTINMPTRGFRVAFGTAALPLKRTGSMAGLYAIIYNNPASLPGSNHWGAYIDITSKTVGRVAGIEINDVGNLYSSGTKYAIYSAAAAPSYFAGGFGDKMIFVPSTAQIIDAVGDTILANAPTVILNPDADYTLTSTPTIADGTSGQIVFITCGNTEANIVTVQDQGTLANSNLRLGANTRAISGRDVLALRFDGTDWCELFFTNVI